jgi:hypothetical protein
MMGFTVYLGTGPQFVALNSKQTTYEKKVGK